MLYLLVVDSPLQRLQVAFNTNHFPDRADKESLAQELGITFQQVTRSIQ